MANSYHSIFLYVISKLEDLKYEEIETTIDFYIVISKDDKIISSCNYIKSKSFNKDRVREEMIYTLLILLIKKGFILSIKEINDNPNLYHTVDKLKKYLNNKRELSL